MTNVLKASPSNTDSSQSPLLRFYRSPIGKKLVSGATGLALIGFVLVHMVGNLLLFIGRDAYNAYAEHLASWGVFLYAVEGLLVGIALLHIRVGISVFIGRLRARPEGYGKYQSVGENSYQSFSSRTMIVTGSMLTIFLGLHLWTFKFGSYYTTELNGHSVRDLAQLVVEIFHKFPYVLGYSSVLLGLGFHLRHGVWSALQSLGVLHAGIRPIAYGVGTLLAVAIALGFVALPWAIYSGLVA
jgi:succinate dehydrogenase / fumarate reductase cytochrome b subunit